MYKKLIFILMVAVFSCQQPLYEVKQVVVEPKGKYYTFKNTGKKACPKPGDTAYILIKIRQPK